MPILRAQVVIPMVSTITADAVTNTWHFDAADDTSGQIAEIQAALVAAYEAADTVKGDNGNWAAARVKWFNMSESEPRVPLEDNLLSLTAAPSTDCTIAEACAVLSFNGDYVSGQSQARRRGRIYFGPLPAAVISVTTGLFSSGITTALAAMGQALLTDSVASSTYTWIVYSPTAGVGYPVVEGWVDNAPDIQRRRGIKATTRTTFT